MSTVKTCSSTFCDSLLNTPQEYKNGICNNCMKLVSDKDTMVSVCWECGSITAITDIRESERPQSYRGLQFPKYLFAKGCRNCLNGNKSLEDSWMTIHKHQPSTLVVDGKGDVWVGVSKEE